MFAVVFLKITLIYSAKVSKYANVIKWYDDPWIRVCLL